MIRHDPRRHGLEHRCRDHAAVFHFRRLVNKNDHQILRFFGGHEPYERRGALSAILAAKRLLRRTGLARHGDAGDGGTLARALIDDLTHHGKHFPRGVLGKNTLVPSAHIVGENDPQGFVHPFIGKRQVRLRHLEHRDRKALSE